MIGKIHVSVFRGERGRNIHIVFWRDTQEGVLALEPTIVEERVVWRWNLVPEGQAPEPSFIIPAIFEELGAVQGLADALERELGVVASGEKEKASRIEALSYHLEDLRKIIFSFDWIELQRGEPLIAKEKEE